jgi:flavin reductase (DIM6/NTAB) family NADH-FMN oxidoreductase RutF
MARFLESLALVGKACFGCRMPLQPPVVKKEDVVPKRVFPPKTWLTPLPAVLVSSAGPEGRPNIMTVAWCGIVCSGPPMLGISVRPATHTHGIIQSSGEFAVNVPDAGLVRVVDFCGNVSGRDVDKFALSRLTPFPATRISAPLIAECPVNLECRVTQVLELGLHHLFLAEILAVHADEELLDAEGHLKGFSPLAYRPELRGYAPVGESLGVYGFSGKEPEVR